MKTVLNSINKANSETMTYPPLGRHDANMSLRPSSKAITIPGAVSKEGLMKRVEKAPAGKRKKIISEWVKEEIVKINKNCEIEDF